MKTTLRCLNCGEIYETEDTVSLNGLPPCGDCGGELTIPGTLEIACCHCDFSQTVTDVNCNDYPHCHFCEWQVVVMSQNYIRPEKDEDEDEENEIETPESLKASYAASTENDVRETIMLAGKADIAEHAMPAKVIDPWDENAVAPKHTGLSSGNFGKYKIIEEIARGGMGIVYKVEDPDLKRPLALKVLIAGEDASEDLLKRFLREARSAAQLNHPNVVPIHEVGNIEGQYFFTMDFIAGPAFDKIIEGNAMPHEDIVRHMRNIALALETAHDAGIVHRDIKPANIIYDIQNERAMLTDFGLAKDLDSNTMLSMTGMMMGSPAYMSPEQAKGMIHDIDPRSDIYSLGVVLFECVTGEQPFQGNTVVETVRKVVYDDPIPPRQLAPDKVNKDLENIILKCMEKEPEDRYQTMRDVSNDLTAYLGGDKVEAKAQPMLKTTWKKLRKKPILLGSIIGTPFALTGIIIVIWSLFFAEGFLDDAKLEIESGRPDRQSSMITQIKAKIDDGRFSSEQDQMKVTELLVYCLKSSDDRVVGQACLLLEQTGGIEAIPALIDLLQNSDRAEKERQSALSALRKIGTKKGADNVAVSEAYIALVKDENTPRDLRIGSIWALVDVWGNNVMSILIKIAKNDTEESEIRVAAIRTCGNKVTVGSPEMNALISLYGDDDKKVRKAAAEALEESRDKTSIFDLYGIKDRTATVSHNLGKVMIAHARNQQRAMDLIKEMNGPVTKKLTKVEAMSKKLKHDSSDVRMTAAYDLGQLGDTKAVPILTEHLTDSDPDVICVTAKSLILLSDKKKPNMKKVLKLLKNKRPIVREQAIFIISKIGDSIAYEIVMEIAEKETNMRVLQSIAKMLIKADSRKALPVLKKLLTKSEEVSNPAAIQCIKSMASFGEPSAPYLVEFLKSTNDNVRTATLNALKNISGRDYGEDTSKWKQWAEKVKN